VSAKWEIFFNVKGKDYGIYKDDSGLWLVDDEMNKCKLVYFAGDEEMMSVITHGECSHLENQGWVLLNKWGLEEVRK